MRIREWWSKRGSEGGREEIHTEKQIWSNLGNSQKRLQKQLKKKYKDYCLLSEMKRWMNSNNKYNKRKRQQRFKCLASFWNVRNVCRLFGEKRSWLANNHNSIDTIVSYQSMSSVAVRPGTTGGKGPLSDYGEGQARNLWSYIPLHRICNAIPLYRSWFTNHVRNTFISINVRYITFDD
jgi:hypothetical protein